MVISLSEAIKIELARLFSLHSKPSTDPRRVKWKSLLIYLLVNIILVAICIVVNVFLGVDLTHKGMDGIEDIREKLPFILILGGSVMPLIEEAIHRLFISQPNKVVWSMVFLILYFVMNGDYSCIHSFIFLTYFVFLMIVVNIRPVNRNPLFMLLGSAFFFAVFHIFNYVEGFTENGLSLLIAVTPQFFGGIILYFVHLNLGFWWGVVHHAVLNITLASFIYFLI